jgi:hypothetical protein
MRMGQFASRVAGPDLDEPNRAYELPRRSSNGMVAQLEAFWPKRGGFRGRHRKIALFAKSTTIPPLSTLAHSRTVARIALGDRGRWLVRQPLARETDEESEPSHDASRITGRGLCTDSAR